MRVLPEPLLGTLQVLSQPFLHPAEDVEHQCGEGDADPEESNADAEDGGEFGRHGFVPSSLNRLTE